MRRREWPNGLGFDIRTSKGEWEILKPFASQPWKARFIPRGEFYPSQYGEGATADEARASAVRVE